VETGWMLGRYKCKWEWINKMHLKKQDIRIHLSGMCSAMSKILVSYKMDIVSKPLNCSGSPQW
jgi:hypothetical protein